MAMSVLLVPADGHEIGLGPDTAARLRALGVTSVALLQDDATLAVVMEGWAFDPAVSAADLEELIGRANAARTLSLVAQASITALSSERK